MKRTKVIPIKWIDEGHDTDRDGVPNYRDCNILNPFEHRGVRPSKTTMKRLEKLPITFVTGRATQKELLAQRKKYTVKSKKVPKEISKTRQRFYSVIKKRPEVVGAIEKIKPEEIVFTSRGGEVESGYFDPDYEVKTETGEWVPKELLAIRLSAERGHPYRRGYIDATGKILRYSDYASGTILHELEHKRQEEKWKKRPKLKQKMIKGRYQKQQAETLAYQAEEKAYRKRYKKTPEETVRRGFRMVMK